MLEFYLFPYQIKVLILFAEALAVIMQTMSVLICARRYGLGKTQKADALAEIAVLGCLLTYMYFIAVMMNDTTEGFMLAPGQGWLRYAAGAVVIAACVDQVLLHRSHMFLMPVIAGLILMPPAETLLGGMYMDAFLLVQALIFARAIHVFNIRLSDYRNRISSGSIKESIDALDAGIMIYDEDGNMMLINNSMQRLMKTFLGHTYRNGEVFRQAMRSGEMKAGCGREAFEGELVCTAPDGTAWKFSASQIPDKKHSYTQVVASDITELWKKTEELELQDADLREKSLELQETIKNINELCRERELISARTHAHDVLGQRLTALIRMLRDGQTLDRGVLLSMSEGIMDDLKQRPDDFPMSGSIEILRRTFESIGVSVEIAGGGMEDLTNCGTPEVQRIVFDVIREAVTNAARHGLATKVEIAVARPAGGFAMTITDNGMNLADDFREGGGITGMREKAQKIGARLTVTPEPRFTIEFAVPGDGVGVSDRAGTGASKAESDSKTGSTDADGAGAAAAKGGEAE